MSREFGDPGHPKWGGRAPGGDTSLGPLEKGIGKPWKTKKKEAGNKGSLVTRRPPMVTAISAGGDRSSFKV